MAEEITIDPLALQYPDLILEDLTTAVFLQTIGSEPETGDYAALVTTAYYLVQTGVLAEKQVREAIIVGWQEAVLDEVSIMGGFAGSDIHL